MSEGGRPELRWGVRASLLRYVSRTGGVVSVGPPASWSEEQFVFPLRETISDGVSSQLAFSGEFRILGHGGLFDVQFADPILEVSDGQGLLTAEDLGRTRRLAFAELAQREEGVFDATLHRGAVHLFGGVYEAGLELDHVHLRIGPDR